MKNLLPIFAILFVAGLACGKKQQQKSDEEPMSQPAPASSVADAGYPELADSGRATTVDAGAAADASSDGSDVEGWSWSPPPDAVTVAVQMWEGHVRLNIEGPGDFHASIDEPTFEESLAGLRKMVDHFEGRPVAVSGASGELDRYFDPIREVLDDAGLVYVSYGRDDWLTSMPRVVAYSFDVCEPGTEGCDVEDLYYPVQPDGSVPSRDEVVSREMTEDQVRTLYRWLRDEKTYGGEVAACFVPRHGFAFFDEGGELFAQISICFECNQLKAQPAMKGFPAVPDVDYDSEDFVPSGFSVRGVDRLIALCNELGLEKCVGPRRP